MFGGDVLPSRRAAVVTTPHLMLRAHPSRADINVDNETPEALPSKLS
jgi:hypothetical protein